MRFKCSHCTTSWVCCACIDHRVRGICCGFDACNHIEMLRSLSGLFSSLTLLPSSSVTRWRRRGEVFGRQSLAIIGLASWSDWSPGNDAIRAIESISVEFGSPCQKSHSRKCIWIQLKQADSPVDLRPGLGRIRSEETLISTKRKTAACSPWNLMLIAFCGQTHSFFKRIHFSVYPLLTITSAL